MQACNELDLKYNASQSSFLLPDVHLVVERGFTVTLPVQASHGYSCSHSLTYIAPACMIVVKTVALALIHSGLGIPDTGRRHGLHEQLNVWGNAAGGSQADGWGVPILVGTKGDSAPCEGSASDVCWNRHDGVLRKQR